MAPGGGVVQTAGHEPRPPDRGDPVHRSSGLHASGTVVERGTVEDKATYEEMLGQSYAYDPGTRTIWVQHYEDSIARVGLEPSGEAP
ncbi:MAG TPA: hypothetical protein VFR44_12615 [Actinomycetota bacterium]|nr:hypothetical protein [Actinomycetota bacterium]